MKLTRLFTPAAVALAITVAAGPALAQSNRDDRQRQSPDRLARATESARRGHDASAGRSSGDVAVRRTEPRAETQRGNSAAQVGRPSDNRGYTTGQYADQQPSVRRNDAGGAAGRQYNTRGYDNRQNGNRQYDTRGYDSGRYDTRQYSNRGYAGYREYDRYSWRSNIRFGLGISIFSGRPFAFRFDYGWRPSFSYRYTMRPGLAYGGMSFLLDPDFAEVYIDGEFVGIARDFGGEPVPVAVGFHRIELYAQGFEPVAFDINVFPGQVIPYRGSLYPVY
jgi:hypothetical protein